MVDEGWAARSQTGTETTENYKNYKKAYAIMERQKDGSTSIGRIVASMIPDAIVWATKIASRNIKKSWPKDRGGDEKMRATEESWNYGVQLYQQGSKCGLGIPMLQLHGSKFG
jgi:hypothetical protein